MELSHFKGETDVSKTVRYLKILAVILGLAMAIPAIADTLSKGITLYNPAKLGGTELKAGDYWLVFDGAKVTLKQGKKVVAEAKAEWVEVKTASRVMRLSWTTVRLARSASAGASASLRSSRRYLLAVRASCSHPRGV